MPRIKKILQWLIIAFVVYAIIKSPNQAASILTTAWQILVDGVAAIGKFFDTLLGR
jgi:large-conductance mechanosensitive channel